MHFEYDPILGLRYLTLEENPSILIYDPVKLPKDLDIEVLKKQWIKFIKESPIIFHEPTPKVEFVEINWLYPTITNNLLSFLWGKEKRNEE